ncbi:MAG: hypothetical protein RLZZ90_924 [Actinomycetota bacterium]
MSENNSQERSFGQGAQGELDAPKVAKVSFITRLRYNFDNSIAKSGTFVVYVLLAMVVMASVMVAIKALLNATPFLTVAVDPANPNTFDVFWASFTKILSLGGEPSWADRIIAVLYWAITIALTGSVIGFITGAIQRAFARLSRNSQLPTRMCASLLWSSSRTTNVTLWKTKLNLAPRVSASFA